MSDSLSVGMTMWGGRISNNEEEKVTYIDSNIDISSRPFG